MYGAQTSNLLNCSSALFENDVEMYGAQTTVLRTLDVNVFENDVEMYGAQTLKTTFPSAILV